MEPALPAFDLVLATVDRVGMLGRVLDSLERQTYRRFRVVVVDQNEDDRLGPVLATRPALDIIRVQAPRGLSRARNVGLHHLAGDVVAFPDDDCVYPDDLLERLAGRFAADAGLDGLTGREVDAAGRSSVSWERTPAVLTVDNLWNRVISFAIFLRRDVVEAVGPFDERLGLGSGTPWFSGEEIDYLVRAVGRGARIEYDPSLAVTHDVKPLPPAALRSIGRRDGASLGYILRKHRYPARAVARMAVRPVGGSLLALARRDTARARFHAATLRGRAEGYRGFRGRG